MSNFLPLALLVAVSACTPLKTEDPPSLSRKDDYIRFLKESNHWHREHFHRETDRLVERNRFQTEVALESSKNLARLDACFKLITDEQKYEILNRVWSWEK